jgi:SPP1 family predicted phage head-tail adaptor
MNPGKRNKWIKIMKFNENYPDGGGGYSDDWETGEGWDLECETWAYVRPIRGRNFYEAQQGQSELTHEVNIRYRPGIDRSMIVVYDGRRFDVQYVMNIEEKNKELELICVERV